MTTRWNNEYPIKINNINAIKKNAARHDAAHIVMSYFLGCTAEYAILLPNGNGEYKIDFGENALMAVPLMISNISPDLFSFYQDKPRPMVEDVAGCVRKADSRLIIRDGSIHGTEFLRIPTQCKTSQD